MKPNDINQLLNGLLGEQKKEEPKPEPKPEPPKKSAASERSLRRVEEFMRDVEQENSTKKASQPKRTEELSIPKREPVPVPPPISHFTEEPSQNPAVRMRDRLDETALPKPDAERKPTQIIPPKPKQEPQKKRKKKKHPNAAPPQVQAEPVQTEQLSAPKPVLADIPAPPTAPKRKIPHIVIPDELPPDIPRDTTIADEIRRKRTEETQPAIAEEVPVTPEPPEVQPETVETEPTAQETAAQQAAEPQETREQMVLRKAERIKQQIRLAMEQAEAEAVSAEQDLPEEQPVFEENPVEDVPDDIEEIDEPEHYEEAEIPKKRGFMGLFRRTRDEAEIEESVDDEIEEAETSEEEFLTEERPSAEEEATEQPTDAPKLKHLSEPKEKRSLFGGFGSKKKQDLTETDEENDAVSIETADFEGESEAFSESFEADTAPQRTDAESEHEYAAPQAEPAPKQTESIHVSLPGEERTGRRQSPFAAAMRAALDENVQELADVKAEPIQEESEIDVRLGKSRFHRRSTYFTVGILCSVFALIGIAACIVYGVGMVRDFTNSTSLKHKLEDVLFPVAVVDLPDFETPSETAPQQLFAAAMLDLLMYGDLSQYPQSFDMFSIPAEDVRRRADEMFGTQLASEYETLYAAGEMFYYDAVSGCYNVPSAPVIFSYAPEIIEIRRSEEDLYVVTVEYRNDTAQWQERSENFVPQSKKTMKITLQKNGDDYTIMRIMNVSEHSDAM